jgi:hypothetical protein
MSRVISPLLSVSGSRILLGMPSKKLPADFREYLAKIGKKGGLKGGVARAAKLTPAQRSESARKAVEARWAREKAAKS